MWAGSARTLRFKAAARCVDDTAVFAIPFT